MSMVECTIDNMSMRKKCELLDINRSRVYYTKKTIASQDVKVVNEMTKINTQRPFYGYRRIHVELVNKGHKINHKKIQRLMQQSGIKALYPKKKTTVSNRAHKKYPYLLRDLVIDRPNKVWCIDITYIKINNGYVYLVCLIDVFSRRIMGWKLSPFLDVRASIEALEMALKVGVPEIINSDQGCQYTSIEWTSTLTEKGIKISMDGKGRWADNIFIERFWRSLKYEFLYLHSLEMVFETREALSRYIDFYNQQRPHQALAYKTPSAIYIGYQKNKLELKNKPLNGLAKGDFENSQKQTVFWS